MNLIGFHTSMGVDYSKLFETAEEHNLPTYQVFTKNHRQWREKEIDDLTGKTFREKSKQFGIKVGMSHCTYLINLACLDEAILSKSLDALKMELLRCDQLGISYAVLHPGAGKGLPEAEAIFRISEGLKIVLKNVPKGKCKILLENTAGQGSSIGWKFEQLRDIIDLTKSDRIGVCFDTCHAFAAGYDIRSSEQIKSVFEKFDKIVGLDKLLAFHINDSKGDLGSRIDRHEHIGKGKIGEEPFKYIVKHFPNHPKIIETDHEGMLHLKDLELLRSYQ